MCPPPKNWPSHRARDRVWFFVTARPSDLRYASKSGHSLALQYLSLRAHKATFRTRRHKRRSSAQFNQQRLRLLQITRVQPVRKPAVNRSEQFARLLRLALVAPEGEAHGGAEFPGFCLLLTCNRERTLEIRFRFRCIRRMRLKRDQGTELPNSKTRSPDPRRAFVLTGSVQPRSCN